MILRVIILSCVFVRQSIDWVRCRKLLNVFIRSDQIFCYSIKVLYLIYGHFFILQAPIRVKPLSHIYPRWCTIVTDKFTIILRNYWWVSVLITTITYILCTWLRFIALRLGTTNYYALKKLHSYENPKINIFKTKLSTYLNGIKEVSTDQ